MTTPTTAEYLDRILKESLELNDRRLRYDSDIAEALGVSKTTMSSYRHGTHHMSVIVAVKIAEILRIHPMETISATMERQAKPGPDKALWRHYYDKYRRQESSHAANEKPPM